MHAQGINPLTGMPVKPLSVTDPLAIQQAPVPPQLAGYSRYDQEKFRREKAITAGFNVGHIFGFIKCDMFVD
jgi:hypothetical protein